MGIHREVNRRSGWTREWCWLHVANRIDGPVLQSSVDVWSQCKCFRLWTKRFDQWHLHTGANSGQGWGFLLLIVLVGIKENQISNLPTNIIGISRTENQIALAEIYSSADIFLNLTYDDNYPTVNLEAIACGCPVLTYDTGGSPESADIYGDTIKKDDLLKNYKELFKKEKYKKINKDISKEKMCEDYIRLYKRIEREKADELLWLWFHY